MTEHHCRWAGTSSPRLLRTHLTDCDTSSCPGCEPCGRRHCVVCGHQHVDQLTCPGCIGDVRTDLDLIAELSERLPSEAIHRGINAEATHLAGPVANPEAWRQRGRYGHTYDPDARLGQDHPLWVLGTWDLAVTELLDHTRRTQKITIPSAASYLRRNLTDLAQHPDFAFDDLASSVRHCRAHLENVLSAGEQIETGAPCLTCHRPLTKTTTEKRHTWTCSRCHRNLTENEYRLAVRAAYVAHATQLTVTDMADRLDIPASTIRRWASVRRVQLAGQPAIEHPPRLRSCGRDASGRKLYQVADVLRLRGESLAPPATDAIA